MLTSDQKQEHTGSYYAATVNEVTDYPCLEGAVSVDVCVVGAGFTGTSTALSLAERGYSVALVEANRVGWGASGRNGGQVINGMGGIAKIRKKHGDGVADILHDIRWRGNDIIRERIAMYNIQCDFKDGFLEVATKPGQVPYLDEYAEDRESHPSEFDYEIWDREKTCNLLGTDAYHGGFVCYRDGHLHPLNLCIGEARAAHGLGVQIFEQSPVTGITHGTRPRVATEDGYIEADSVVLAGNAYSKFEPKHLSNLIFPAGSYVIATEPLADDVAHSINKKDVAVCDLNEVVDYYRLSADNRLLYGGACNYSGRDMGRQDRYRVASHSNAGSHSRQRLLLPGLFGPWRVPNARHGRGDGGRGHRHDGKIRSVRRHEALPHPRITMVGQSDHCARHAVLQNEGSLAVGTDGKDGRLLRERGRMASLRSARRRPAGLLGSNAAPRAAEVRRLSKWQK
jgi:glycine/D-amino acid oxidase-like deaminating enzyme